MDSYGGISEEPLGGLEAGTLRSKLSSFPNGHIGDLSTDTGGVHHHKPLSRHGRTAHSLSANSLRKKSDAAIIITKVLFFFSVVIFVLLFLLLARRWILIWWSCVMSTDTLLRSAQFID